MSIIINGHYFRKKTSKHGLKISPIERITVLNISEDTAKVAKGHLAEGEKSQYIFDMKIDKIIEKPTTADYKLLVNLPFDIPLQELNKILFLVLLMQIYITKYKTNTSKMYLVRRGIN